MKKKSNNFVNPYEQDNNDNIGMGNDVSPCDSTPIPTNSNKSKKKVKKLNSKRQLIIVSILGLLLLVIFIIVGVMKKNYVVPTPIPTHEITENIDSPKPSEDVVPPDVTSSDVIETPIPVETEVPEKYSYENDILGIKFNFDSNLYMKENVADIFNIVKEVLPEGRDDFNIFSDKLPSILNIVKLTTGDSDGLYISISILPFEIEKETTTLKIDGTTEVKNESIEAINLTDDELIEKYDTQIKQTLVDTNCEIISYDKSSIIAIGDAKNEDGTNKFKGILTSRVYKGDTDITTQTGIVDVIQCTIPVGKNAILITAVTDGSPIEIDKSELLNQIVNSLVITTEGPLKEDVLPQVTETNAPSDVKN